MTSSQFVKPQPAPEAVDQAWSEGLYQAVRARHHTSECGCPQLVDHLLQRTEHPAVCPQCGGPASSEITWTNGTVTEAHYLCANNQDHAWTTKWTAAA